MTNAIKRALGMVVVTGGLALSALTAQAESLNDAMAAAYQSNPTILAARAGQRATDELVPTALSGWRPTVSVSGSLSHQWTNTPVTIPVFKDTNGDKVPDTFGSSVSKQTIREAPVDVTIQLEQPIFQGFATVEGVKSAEATVRAGQQNLLAVEQATLFDAVTAYMDVYAGRQLVGLARENVGVLQAQLRASNDRFAVGEITRTDVAQSQASLADAQSQLAEREAELAAFMATYLQIIGREPGKLSYPKIHPLPKSLNTALASAGEINPNILAAAFVEDASIHNIAVAKSPLYPQLSAFAQSGVSDDFVSSSGTTEFAVVGANLSWQLYSGGAVSSAIRQAKQLASQRRIEVVEVARAVRQAVTASWNAYAAFGLIIKSAKAQVAAEQLAFEGTRQEYEAGTRTTLDVLNAQAAVVAAKTTLVRAERNRVVAAYRLIAAVGRLNAADLRLAVTLYDPNTNYDAVRDKWIGWSVDVPNPE
jgi:outer membrane protein